MVNYVGPLALRRVSLSIASSHLCQVKINFEQAMIHVSPIELETLLCWGRVVPGNESSAGDDQHGRGVDVGPPGERGALRVNRWEAAVGR